MHLGSFIEILAMARTTACFLACAFGFLLPACIPIDAVRTPEHLAPATDDQAGFVFGSIGSPSIGRRFSSQRLVFRAKGAAETGSFSFSPMGLVAGVPADFEDEDTKGAVFFARLPTGDYEIVDVIFFSNSQFGSTTYTAKQKFSVPFTVTQGKAIYLGEFIAYPAVGRSLFGSRPTAGGYFVVSDRFDRDVAMLKMKEGAPKTASFVKSVVDPDAVALPFFQRWRAPE